MKDLYVEKNVTSEIEGLEEKRPDIQFEYRDRKVVYELPISSTYLSVITERELFYRLKQHSVLWVSFASKRIALWQSLSSCLSEISTLQTSAMLLYSQRRHIWRRRQAISST